MNAIMLQTLRPANSTSGKLNHDACVVLIGEVDVDVDADGEADVDVEGRSKVGLSDELLFVAEAAWIELHISFFNEGRGDFEYAELSVSSDDSSSRTSRATSGDSRFNASIRAVSSELVNPKT